MPDFNDIHPQGHPTRALTITGVPRQVDRKIFGLIKFLNQLPGIWTNFSCQGDYTSEEPLQGYVSFSGPNADRLFLAFLKLCHEDVMIKGSRHHWVNGWLLHWFPWNYRRVFKAFRDAAVVLALVPAGS